jgi:hypothetical protein
MKKFFEGVFEAVFSFTTFMLMVFLLLGYAMTQAVLNEREEQALEQATVKACYNVGLVKVDTEAGVYCVAPANLVKVK